MSFLSGIFGDGGARRAELENRRQKELSFSYEEFRWKAEPLVTMGKTDELVDLFVMYAVESQIKNPGEEGQILLEFDRIVKELIRKPRENIRRGRFDGI